MCVRMHVRKRVCVYLCMCVCVVQAWHAFQHDSGLNQSVQHTVLNQSVQHTVLNQSVLNLSVLNQSVQHTVLLKLVDLSMFSIISSQCWQGQQAPSTPSGHSPSATPIALRTTSTPIALYALQTYL